MVLGAKWGACKRVRQGLKCPSDGCGFLDLAALAPARGAGGAVPARGAEPYLWKARLLQPANAPGNTELERAERW